MDKYRPCPSIIAMFTSDSQHPPRSRHAVYLGEDSLPHFLACYGQISLSTNDLCKHFGPRSVREQSGSVVECLT